LKIDIENIMGPYRVKNSDWENPVDQGESPTTQDEAYRHPHGLTP